MVNDQKLNNIIVSVIQIFVKLNVFDTNKGLNIFTNWYCRKYDL